MKKLTKYIVLGLIVLASTASLATAEVEEANTSGWLTAVAPEAEKISPLADDTGGWTKPVPLSFSIDYTLVSDYIFRGINFSEYRGEGREKPNHQMGVGVEYDTEVIGSFGATFWWEWFTAQNKLTPGYGGNNQEIDYSVYWSYEIAPIDLTVETGWIAYEFPSAKGDAGTTYEWYFTLSYDDSGLFGTENPVLNPYFAFYMDVDLADNASWMEFGVSHDFVLADMGASGFPILKDMTVTPSIVAGLDQRYLSRITGVGRDSTRLANIVYGLAVAYDLSGALNIPEQYGSLGITGFLNFSDALRDDILNDEFWGGMTVGYEW
jgi:hypothetical protein